MHDLRKNKAQISLEFLVILVAMIAILIVFLPVFSKLQSSVLLAVDVYSASKSLNEFKSNVSMLNTLENGSSFEFNYKFINTTKFTCENKRVSFTIQNHNQNKTLALDLALDCSFSIDSKMAKLYVTKESSHNINISLPN